MLPKFVHQHLNTTRTGARAKQEQSRWTQSVWFSLERRGSTGSWEAPTNWAKATPNGAVPRRSLWGTKADGSQHAGGQQHRTLGATPGRTGSTTPSSSTEAGKSSSEKRTTSTIRSQQWWEISPGGSQWPSWVCGAAEGSGSGTRSSTEPLLKSRSCSPCPCARWERGKGSTCSPHLPAECSQPVASWNTGSPTAVEWPPWEALLNVVLWWGNLRQQD